MSSRTLIFCFDGTWNQRDGDYDTNVEKLHAALRVAGQESYYFAGPGNDGDNHAFMKFMGGAFGAGSWEIRDEALRVLKAAYRDGDTIAVIGFSRGAAIARMFCARLGEDGVRDFKPRVAFLGCFDTVGAYLPFGIAQQGIFHDLNVSQIVDTAAHVVAIDEDRKAFAPNLMNQREGITEVWMPGVHGDVGGGQAETGHSDGALRWMVDQMAAARIFAVIETHPNPDAPIGVNLGIYPRERRRRGVKVDGKWVDPNLGGFEILDEVNED